MQEKGVPTPSGVTAPNPVTTTLRIASRKARGEQSWLGWVGVLLSRTAHVSRKKCNLGFGSPVAQRDTRDVTLRQCNRGSGIRAAGACGGPHYKWLGHPGGLQARLEKDALLLF
jgi:hypothetical protein